MSRLERSLTEGLKTYGENVVSVREVARRAGTTPALLAKAALKCGMTIVLRLDEITEREADLRAAVVEVRSPFVKGGRKRIEALNQEDISALGKLGAEIKAEKRKNEGS